VFPALAGRVDLVCQELNDDRICEAADVIFTALPHKLPMKMPRRFSARPQGDRPVGDFRFNDAGIYEKVYQPHTAKELLSEAVYGRRGLRGRSRPPGWWATRAATPPSVLLPWFLWSKRGSWTWRAS
jgi:N-acetyl-gamma-glutamyl-phosphate reductase